MGSLQGKKVLITGGANGLGGAISLVAGILGFVPGRDPGNPIFGMAAVVLFPVAYGLAGFVTTLIGAWLYNGLAGLVGGVEIELR